MTGFHQDAMIVHAPESLDRSTPGWRTYVPVRFAHFGSAWYASVDGVLVELRRVFGHGWTVSALRAESPEEVRDRGPLDARVLASEAECGVGEGTPLGRAVRGVLDAAKRKLDMMARPGERRFFGETSAEYASRCARLFCDLLAHVGDAVARGVVLEALSRAEHSDDKVALVNALLARARPGTVEVTLVPTGESESGIFTPQITRQPIWAGHDDLGEVFNFTVAGWSHEDVLSDPGYRIQGAILDGDCHLRGRTPDGRRVDLHGRDEAEDAGDDPGDEAPADEPDVVLDADEVRARLEREAAELRIDDERRR